MRPQRGKAYHCPLCLSEDRLIPAALLAYWQCPSCERLYLSYRLERAVRRGSRSVRTESAS